jgi:hypothetical protein
MKNNTTSNSATNPELRYMVFRGMVLPKTITLKIDILREREKIENLRANRGYQPVNTDNSSLLCDW